MPARWRPRHAGGSRAGWASIRLRASPDRIGVADAACMRLTIRLRHLHAGATPVHGDGPEMDGNWGNDPWRCWELSPIDDRLKRALIAKWNLAPRPGAFNGVASGGKIY